MIESKLSVYQAGMLDNLTGQVRNALVDGSVTPVPPEISMERLLVTSLSWAGTIKRILLVYEDNIKSRLQHGNASWRIRSPLSLRDFDVEGIAVYYGACQEPGALWEASTGNPNKEDYRRLSYKDRVIYHYASRTYREIETHLTEANLVRFFQGEPLGER